MYLMILWKMNMEKNEVNKKQWGELHKNKRYRPKYLMKELSILNKC